MAKASRTESNDGAEECCGSLDLNGKISRETLVRLDLDNGTTVVAPEAMMFKPGALGNVGDIIDIVCKLTGWCGPGGGGPGPPVQRLCPKVVVTPDGTITITMVPCGTAIA